MPKRLSPCLRSRDTDPGRDCTCQGDAGVDIPDQRRIELLVHKVMVDSAAMVFEPLTPLIPRKTSQSVASVTVRLDGKLAGC
jgi:hypothetical protein